MFNKVSEQMSRYKVTFVSFCGQDEVVALRSKTVAVNFTPDDLWGAFCKVLNDAIDLYVPSAIIRNYYTSSVLRKYPRRIQTLFTRKRCVWRQMRSNPNDTVLRSNYKRLVYECTEATKDYERSQEASILESQNISCIL